LRIFALLKGENGGANRSKCSNWTTTNDLRQKPRPRQLPSLSFQVLDGQTAAVVAVLLAQEYGSFLIITYLRIMGRARGKVTAVSEGSRHQQDLSELIDEWAQADANAPRRDCASVASFDHPQRNEDRVLCDPALQVAAVFDGMGGAAGGELAARAACGAFVGELAYFPKDPGGRRQWLASAVEAAANAVRLSKRFYRQQNLDLEEQETTAAALVVA
jgi:hypothetical protein